MESLRKNERYKYNPFKHRDHKCHVQDELVDPVEVAIPETEKFWSLKRKWARFITVCESDAISQKLFKSSFAIEKEKLRHLKNYRWMIHPASKLRAHWESMMIIIYMANLIFIPLYMALLQDTVENERRYIKQRFCLELFFVIDIILSFATGIQSRSDYKACLDSQTVAISYMKGTFFLDFLAWIPFDFINQLNNTQNSLYTDIFLILKLSRLFVLLRYLENFGERMKIELLTVRVLKMVSIFFYYTIWVCFLQFFVVFLAEGSHRPKHPDPNSWMSRCGVWKADKSSQFFIGLHRAGTYAHLITKQYVFRKYPSVSVTLITLQGTGSNSPITSYDRAFAATVWLSSWVLNTYMISMTISIMLGTKSSKSQYYMTIKQLNAFMERMDLPQHLQDKIQNFYDLRYRRAFFSESDILKSISGRLLQDVMMHSCRKIVEDVPFLKNLPDDMLVRIVTTLRSEIFLPNEVIVKEDSIGDCMYFIVKGTVAVYSSRGHEMCHLHDGDHFGEVAVVGGPRRRTAFVVALEPCELLRLDAAELALAAARHPNLLEDIMRRAADRVEHTLQVDRAV